jgi:O-acetyl-ADP-ribose deacetylase (regulator of RNase III)
LELESGNDKALCRLAESLIGLKDISGAKEAIGKVSDGTKTDPAVKKIVRTINDKEKEQREREVRMYKGIFAPDKK